MVWSKHETIQTVLQFSTSARLKYCMAIYQCCSWVGLVSHHSLLPKHKAQRHLHWIFCFHLVQFLRTVTCSRASPFSANITRMCIHYDRPEQLLSFVSLFTSYLAILTHNGLEHQWLRHFFYATSHSHSIPFEIRVWNRCVALLSSCVCVWMWCQYIFDFNFLSFLRFFEVQQWHKNRPTTLFEFIRSVDSYIKCIHPSLCAFASKRA